MSPWSWSWWVKRLARWQLVCAAVMCTSQALYSCIRTALFLLGRYLVVLFSCSAETALDTGPYQTHSLPGRVFLLPHAVAPRLRNCLTGGAAPWPSSS